MEKLTSSLRIKAALDRMNIKTFKDVLYHLPRTYDSFEPTDLTSLEDKQKIVIVGKRIGPMNYVKRGRLTIINFLVNTAKGYFFRVVAFNRPYLMRFVNEKDTYTITGRYDAKRREINLSNIVKGEMEPSEYLKPIYSLTKDLKNFEFERLVKKAFKETGNTLYNNLPEYLNKKYRFISESEALRKIHFPKNEDDIYQGLRVLKYEESLMFSLQTQLIREQNKLLFKGEKTPIELKKVNDFVVDLPYKLTKSQLNGVREIILDMNKPSLMYRLLQGDVGSGKTVVAATALYANFLRGDQGAFLAPTDALARQHFENLQASFKNFPVKIELLVGNLTEKRKNEIKDAIVAGDIHLIVGTHALFSGDVFYNSLGLVVIDEQHRFGVNQRAALAAKGDHADLLLISATPIPRTLAMSVYGDLDVTTLDQFPGHKRDITTMIVNSSDETIAYSIKQALERGEQIFIIAPRIEEVEDNNLAAETLYQQYSMKYKGLVTLLHGRLEQEEKLRAFEKFKSGEKPILVATSVVEVGIDVPNASLMLIYAPTHFGLASLHQLRGRIGRKGQPSTCLLVGDDFDEIDEEKLNVLVNSNDGFYIAEKDLLLRGPGELSGVSQSGLPSFRYVNLISDFEMFKYARKDAEEIISDADNDDNRLIIEKAKILIERDGFVGV
ncbi:MAG: ATP-dependent DNA helicase RecG [Erysipelotrichaceae bacterium]|nr:ATP-dependent DNA helicase RecG [Erysipelotrichaceae bacterium]